MSELERVSGFLRRADEGASTSVVPFRFGLAFLNAELPRVYDRNFLLVTGNGEAIDAKSVRDAADALLGGAGLAHRKIAFEDAQVGERMAGAFGGDGWEHRRLAVMTYRGGAEHDPRAKRDETSEVDRIALLPALEALVRTEPWGDDEEVVRQLSAADAALADAVSQRCFARLVDGRVVSSCRLYSDGSIAQIEDVATIPEHRQRGYGEAVVMRAVGEASSAHDLVFLTAVDGRWVKRWYERLGFEQVGLRYEATRAG